MSAHKDKKNCEEVITDSKTEKSIRTIKMPDFLNEETQEYLNSLYKHKPSDQIFPITKGYLHSEMKRGYREQDVKKIEI